MWAAQWINYLGQVGASKAAGAVTREAHGLRTRRERESPEQIFPKFSKNNPKTRRNVGGNLSCRVQLPALFLFNCMCQMLEELVVEACFCRQESVGRRESYLENIPNPNISLFLL